MKLLAETDPFAIYPHYYVPGSLAHGCTIASIVEENGFESLDSKGVAQYLDKAPDGIRTCFSGIKKLLPNHQLVMADNKLTVKPLVSCLSSNNLHELLINALKQATSGYHHCAVALSGGLDSALVLSLIKEASLSNVEVFTLATGINGYCELETTKRTAKYFGVELNIIQASPADFINALPDVISSVETPIYNLHPVSKLLLARAVSQHGVDCIITGDAADQAFSGSPANNYLPLVGAIMRNEGIGYASPFFDKQVVTYGLSVIDTNKSALRELGKSLVPEFLHCQKKQPRLAPAFDISKYWDSNNITWISEYLNMQPDIRQDCSKTLWTTLGMLALLMREKIACAA